MLCKPRMRGPAFIPGRSTPNRAPQSMLSPLVELLAAALVAIPAVEGLICFETVNGSAAIVQDDSWSYCALVPTMSIGRQPVEGRQFGLGAENDVLGAYNSAFGQSSEEYRIMTVCIYERYDFGSFLRIKPDQAVEYTFRCVCNYDLCNSESTFDAYLTALKTESGRR